jgi:outer membrane protein assembly factor BamB
LWVVNQADDSVTIVLDAGLDTQSTENLLDPYALHFMEEVSSIAFGQPGTFGTCQESRNTYNDQGGANDFMGPTLWSSDMDVFATSNPDAVDYLSTIYNSYVDLGSHLDMQHETPLCTGIAWERDNRYWTFDGLNQTIDMVDFNEDHGVGYDDHSDGVTAAYDSGGVTYTEGISNHMVFDQETAMLYISDPGNGRVMVLDTTAGTQGSDLPINEPFTEHYEMDGVAATEFIVGLDTPSGLALQSGVLFVADYKTGTVYAFDLDSGTQVDSLAIGRGVMGITAPYPDELWLTDPIANEVIRITPRG